GARKSLRALLFVLPPSGGTTCAFSAGVIWMNSQSTSAHHDQSMRRFIRRLALLLAFRQSLTFVTVWCFLWGAVALVLRAPPATTRRQLLWGAVGIAIVAIAAAVVSRRRLPSRDSVRALLDSRNDCGGGLLGGRRV